MIVMNEVAHEKEFMDAFSQYGDAIFRFCLFKVSDPARAEDMTQEVFMRYWQYLRDGSEMRNTRSLLYTIANNLAKDWYKRKKAQSLDAEIAAGAEPADREPDPEAAARYRELLSTIDDLEEGDREVLLLRFVEGYQPREIAELLGESANTISVRITRAKERLESKLHL